MVEVCLSAARNIEVQRIPCLVKQLDIESVTAAKCKSGVSKVETQLSFVNQLVNFLTGGIFTPMAITVTCAAGGRAEIQGAPTVLLGANASMEQAREAFSGAVQLALDTKRPVYVAF